MFMCVFLLWETLAETAQVKPVTALTPMLFVFTQTGCAD